MSQAKQQDDGQKYYDTHSAGTEWGTPVEIWRPLAEPLDGFDIDLAAGAERYPIADQRITKEDNIFATEISQFIYPSETNELKQVEQSDWD